MTQLYFADLVRERCMGEGTGALALSGALPGHRSFAASVPVGARFHYCIAGVSNPAQWEVGEGAIGDDGRLMRNPLTSSNDGALVDFGAGLKTVALTVAAPWFSARDSVAQAPTLASIPGLTAALDNKQPAASLHPCGAVLADTDRVTGWTGSGYVTVPAAHFVRKTADGRVGIGIAAPTQALDVDGLVKVGPVSGKRLTMYADSGYAGFYNGASLVANESIYMGDGGVYFYAGGAETLRVYADQIWARGDNQQSLGAPSRRFSVVYAGSGAISTSDARSKRSISMVPDDWLDAWGDVEWCRYKFRGQASQSGRWHVGLIAQKIRDCFAAHGIDATAIGLLCHDAWEEARAPVISKRTGKAIPNRTRRTTKAGDRWGLRYDECLAMEAAWVRRELARLRE